MRRWLIGPLCALLVLVLLAGAALTVVIRAPLPRYDGAITLSGPSDEITVSRDGRGIPHIYASSDHDLFFAQGYVQAQDRFFQMDMSRHLTAGRLSEMVGEAGKESDIAMRTMGLRRVAEQEWELISEESRGFYQAYADGVNAYLEGKAPWQVANEYAVMGLSLPVGDIEPWSGIDSLSWFKMLSSQGLSSTHVDEAWNMQMLQTLGSPAAVEQLSPAPDEAARRPILLDDGASNLRPRSDYPVADPLPVPEHDAEVVDCPEPADGSAPGEAASAAESAVEHSAQESTASPVSPASMDAMGGASGALQEARRTLDAVPAILGQGPGIGSNSFVVSGSRTASGSPIIGNDPHLQISYPSVWSQVGLHCTALDEDCTFDVEGFSFAGMPGVVIGRNPQLAWAFTNLSGDPSDLVVEQNAGDGTYRRDGACLAYTTRTESFEVAGGEPFEVEVRESVHGPIVSGLFAPDESFEQLPGVTGDFSVAVQWTALMPNRSGEAWFALNRSTGAEGIAAAAALLADPAQNILFATAEGDIGYQASGRYPIRPIKAPADQQATMTHETENLGADGRWPRPGWDSSYDWQGFYAPEDMPAVLNPPDGIIAPANQPVTPEASGPYLGLGRYAPGYRSQQIYDVLAQMTAEGPITAEQAGQVMLLDHSPQADELAPALTAVELSEPRLQELQQALATWYAEGAHMSTDSRGAAIMAALYSHLGHAALGDEMGDHYTTDSRMLGSLVADPGSPLWDDTATPEVEDAETIMRRAWAAADADLTAQMGQAHTTWAWGRIHVQKQTHQILGGDGVPSMVQRLFNADSRPVSGAGEIPNASWYDSTVKDGRVDYQVVAGASMRMAVDMADVDGALWVISSGTSGHPLSPHVNDQFEAWAEGRMHPWPFSRRAIEASALHTLRLRPA
ncbi:penicillin acylase family protein [Actinomyces bowdenii]|nr:penicillin acylase family protein [Actinomyces bowdenii]